MTVALDPDVLLAVAADAQRCVASMRARVDDAEERTAGALTSDLRWRLRALLTELRRVLDRTLTVFSTAAGFARRVQELDRAASRRPAPWGAGLRPRRAPRRTRRRALLDVAFRADVVFDLDLTGDGRAVVAIGDPTSAPLVATLVPGIGTTVDDLPGLVDQARTLRDRASGLQPDEVAVIVWLGHDAPPGPIGIASGILRGTPVPVLRAIAPGPIQAAGRDLASLTDRLRAANPEVHHTLVGHSHGATVVAAAARATTDGRGADEVVLLGAPGTGPTAPPASDAPGWWSAAAPWDPVPFLPVLGPRPTSVGAVALDVGPGNVGHGAYLAAGTWGLDAVAQVVVGRNGCPVPIPPDPHRDRDARSARRGPVSGPP